MPPEADIVHQTSGRLRIRIAEKKADPYYFLAIREKFSKLSGFETLVANSRTGSILFIGKHIDADAIFRFARDNHLFTLHVSSDGKLPLSVRVVRPIGEFNRLLNRFTRGEIDLTGCIFLVLLVSGVFQILRGNMSAPPSV